jgi:hypothetical protein
MLRAGVPLKVASGRLGHSGIGITANLYQHVGQAWTLMRRIVQPGRCEDDPPDTGLDHRPFLTQRWLPLLAGRNGVDVVGQILNFVYFAVGLGVGAFGIYLSVRFFLAQQQDKFNQIAHDIAGVRELLVSLSIAVSQQASTREERLFALATRQEIAVSGAATLATDEIKEIVQQELSQAGVSDAVQRTQTLEAQFSEIVIRSAEQAVEATRLTRGSRKGFAMTDLLEVLKSLGDRPFSAERFAFVADLEVPVAREMLDVAVRNGWAELVSMNNWRSAPRVLQ